MLKLNLNTAQRHIDLTYNWLGNQNKPIKNNLKWVVSPKTQTFNKIISPFALGKIKQIKNIYRFGITHSFFIATLPNPCYLVSPYFRCNFNTLGAKKTLSAKPLEHGPVILPLQIEILL